MNAGGRLLFLGVVAGAFVPAEGAYAQTPSRGGPPTLLTTSTSCTSPPWSVGAWAELLRVELSADNVVVQTAPPAASSGPHLSLTPSQCDSGIASSSLVLSAAGTTLTRTVNLADVAPNARARVLAIAMADLVRSALPALRSAPAAAPRATLDVRISLEAAPAPVPTPAAPPPPAQRPRDVAPSVATPEEGSKQRPRLARNVLSAVAETRVFAQGVTGLFGGRIGLARAIGEHVSFGVDAGALRGGAHDPLGEIELIAVTGSTALTIGNSFGGLWLGVGPRLELGAGFYRGRPASDSATGGSASSFLALASVTVQAAIPIARGFAALASFDVGTTLYGFGALADVRRAATLEGPMLGLRVGFGWGREPSANP